MKILSSSIQYFTEYSQHNSEQRRATFSATSATSSSSETQQETENRQFNDLQTSQRVALNSSQSINTYSTSTIRSNGEEAAKQLTTENAVSSMLSRFYSQNIRLTNLELSPDLNQRIASNDQKDATMGISSYYELQSSQALSFVAKGEINTADGRNINFQFYVNAKQDFSLQKGSGVYASQVAQRTDPLVINLSGNYNNLSSSTFSFDLNADGKKETLSFAGSGSGFLVIDKNEDGKINNGGEMFGPSTGNGFNELAKYDEDGNGFIDAGDAAFSDLKVWTKDNDGKDTLLSLKEADIAAISVESGKSSFQIKDDYNNEFGQTQATGIFVRESGDVGSIQQINLTHRDLEQEQALKEEFDNAEAIQEQSQRQTQNAPIPIQKTPINMHQIEEAMHRLDKMTEAMLKRQDELAEINDNRQPKSLIAQIVEKLEEIRQEQAKKAKEDNNSASL